MSMVVRSRSAASCWGASGARIMSKQRVNALLECAAWLRAGTMCEGGALLNAHHYRASGLAGSSSLRRGGHTQ